ncbi:MAG: tRNA lysidine(34) synthetase TilS [Actinomycetes bacterium]
MQSAGLRAAVNALDVALSDLVAGNLVLVGCSGGADSLGLAVVAAQLARRGRLRFGAVAIDHQLQPGSDAVASRAAEQCRDLGLEPVEVIAVDVPRGPGVGGMEAAARGARRAALVGSAQLRGATAVLLAHTREDQAETVLLGLARGSGSRSLAGIAPRDGLWRRPLLSFSRADIRALCHEFGLKPFDDPHNDDPRFLRVRVRHDVLPVMQSALGPGVVEALARTASLLRQDCDALDALADAEYGSRVTRDLGDVVIAINGDADRSSLVEVPAAVRKRVLRLAMLAAGCPPGSLTYNHLEQADRLISSWRGQGAVRLPADRELGRQSATLVIRCAEPLNPSFGTTDNPHN